MPAYIVTEIVVTDPERDEAYKRMVVPSLTAYGGKFLVRGGTTETLEGSWAPGRFVILEFSSSAQAKAWWNSPQYAEAKALRQATARTQMILAEGL